jgi:hypothetical protein
MGICTIGFFVFCVAMVIFIFVGIQKNILTRYGVGLLIAIFVFEVIGYDIWEDYQIRSTLELINTASLDIERVRLLNELVMKFGVHP